MRNWQQIAIRLAWALGAGVAISVLVAWALIWNARGLAPLPPSIPPPGFTGPTEDSWRDPWPVRVPSDWPPLCDAEQIVLRPGVRYQWWERTTQTYSNWWTVDVTTAGWPAHALRSTVLMRQDPPQEIWSGIRLPRSVASMDGLAQLPITPIWPGFALNTALYGVLAFLLWWAPGVIRRRVRTRRGRCAHCGYDLRGLAGQSCPECGR